jgi:hypothetical protein
LARGFLWKILHSAYKFGEFWKNIPNMEHLAICGFPDCTTEETVKHILLDCEQSHAAKALWNLAKELWTKQEDFWPEINFGVILACNLTNFQNMEGKRMIGKCRLFTILITETAHLIWKIWCERVIQWGNNPENFHTPQEIKGRWLNCINTCLKMDRLHTSFSRFGKKATKESIVLETWSTVLMNEENLPDNWIWESSVLLGIRSQCSLGHS